jgi:ATP-grasp domain
VLIGMLQEPMFGPLVVLGLGGAATEVLGDHAARLAPLTEPDELIHAALTAPLLSGHRDTPPVDTAALADVLRVSRLADDLPEVAELNLGSVAASPDGVCAVDVRVRVSPAEPRDPFLRRLRCRSSYPRAGSPSQPAHRAGIELERVHRMRCTRRSLVPRMVSGLVCHIPLADHVGRSGLMSMGLIAG